MTVLEAAEKILTEAGHPLSTRELTEQMLLKGYWKTQARTPEATVKACLAVDLKTKGKASIFIRPKPGHYGLKNQASVEKPEAAVEHAASTPG